MGNTPIVFAADKSEITYTISLIDNSVLEARETFNLSLTLTDDSYGVLGEISSAVITIIDDDEVTIQFYLNPCSPVSEGQGSLSITIFKIGFSDIPVSVQVFTVENTAEGKVRNIILLKRTEVQNPCGQYSVPYHIALHTK